jgi:hypothetical protein
MPSTKRTNEDTLNTLEHAIEHVRQATNADNGNDQFDAAHILIEAHQAIGPCGSIPSWEQSVCIEDFCGRGPGGYPTTFSCDYFPFYSTTYFTGDWGADVPPMPCDIEPTQEQAYAWARKHGSIY